MPPQVDVVIVNWNRWHDTVQCLESLFRSDYPCYRVIVCDNGSRDGSVEGMRAWARGDVLAPIPDPRALRGLVQPPVPKPLECVVVTGSQAVSGAFVNVRAPLTIVALDSNLGYAAANNVGMRYALTRDFLDYVWLLNNDTLVTRSALSALVDRLDRSPRGGMCGSTLVRFYDPEVVQARGGASYDRWFALPHHLGEGERIEQSVEHGKIEDRLDYIIGASLLASRRMVTDIGLMSEDYFLYFEDLDWALRARGQYDLAYASTSIVYHVEGASTGGNASPTDRPLTSDYYWLRNRLRISARYYPYALPTVILACIGSVIRRILSGRPAHAGRLVKLLATQAWRKPPVPEALEGCGTEGRSP